MSSSNPLLSELAEEISRNTSIILEHLKSHDLPQPSFDPDGLSHPIPEENEELSAARHALIEASKEGLNKELLALLLRLAAVNYCFTEPRRGFVAHTAWSKTLATDPKMRACVWFRHSEMIPPVAKLVEAAEAYTGSPEAAEPRIAAYRLAFGDTFFDYKERHPGHMIKFGQFVDVFATGIEADMAESFARAYAWETLLGTESLIEARLL
ncbi:hypothetical protein B0I37DRAFT_449322 [Chaetomium sp. MPI-CAGE-AT-0009]|nr:hypothetical protein B0I37DRAFT_449322 [Chaetomium sp. MPI-CAGE-AT-0009]